MKKDLYVDQLAEETGYLFEKLAIENYDMNKVIPIYMKSAIRERCDKRDPISVNRMFWEQKKEIDKEIEPYKLDYLQYEPSLCEWLGQFYTYLQLKLKISSRELIKKYPFSELYARSKGLHDLTPEKATQKIV